MHNVKYCLGVVNGSRHLDGMRRVFIERKSNGDSVRRVNNARRRIAKTASGRRDTTEFIVREDGTLAEKAPQASTRRLAESLGLDPLTHEAHLMLVRAYTSLTATVRRNNPSSLSLGRYNVLRLLYGAEDRRLLMSEIGDGLEISPTVVTRLVDALVADGLVRRVDHPDDKRKTWAEITPEGIALFEAELPLMMQEIEKLWVGMEPEEKRLLIHLLSKLRLNLLTAAAREAAKRAAPAGVAD